MKRTFKTYILSISLIIIAIDQLLKYLIIKKIPDQGIFIVAKDLFKFKLELVKNPHIAFGIKLPEILIYFIIVIILVFLYYLLIKSFSKNKKLLVITLTIIISAAISNLIDRLIHNSVIDYLSFSIYNFYWPTFNLADLLIVIAVIILIINLLLKKPNNQLTS